MFMKVDELVGQDPKTNKRTVWIGWTHLKLLRILLSQWKGHLGHRSRKAHWKTTKM